ncbi:hypothetical protein [Lentzea sp.]|uniref:hypothetical protein n=1 Tax=Lentzea sp. TaxID=56099 RepID=UPI002CB29D5F|nr:hypothetical protein [Lentzea sp.]HUQ55127.1 hypothetical protein [Lentzea sp.]
MTSKPDGMVVRFHNAEDHGRSDSVAVGMVGFTAGNPLSVVPHGFRVTRPDQPEHDTAVARVTPAPAGALVPLTEES